MHDGGVRTRLLIAAGAFGAGAVLGVFFGHTLPHYQDPAAIWAVTIGTNMSGFTPVYGETTWFAGAEVPSRGLFWREAALLGVVAGAPAVLLAAGLTGRTGPDQRERPEN